MALKKANLKRLASLSALGTGALGVSAGTAGASTIVYSGILDEKIGFHGSHFRGSFQGPNGAGALLQAISYTGPQHSSDFGVKLRQKPGPDGTQFLFLAGTHNKDAFAWAFPGGGLWGSATVCSRVGCKPRKSAYVAYRFYTYGDPFTWKFTPFNAKGQYLLFEFAGGKLATPLYGWAQLQATFTGHEPTVTLVDWAYDTSGAQIPAGDTGTPEPSTLELTGLAALALGAKNLRAWRKGRPPSPNGAPSTRPSA